MRLSVMCLLSVMSATYGYAAPTNETSAPASCPPQTNCSKRIKGSISRLKHTGGKVVRPNSQKGKIALINAAGEKLPRGAAENVILQFTKEIKVRIEETTTKQVRSSDLASEMKSINANAAVFVEWNDSNDIPLLYAPEQNWSIVNLKALGDGADKGRYFERVRKELLRALAYVSGAGGSMSGEGLMNATSVSSLDCAESLLGIDILSRLENQLPNIGVTQSVEDTYINACRQGWAPPPENKYQQAIWDKIHETPKTPMKIEFDPKKGR